MKNYYQTFGLEQNCTKEEIKKAFKYHSSKLHPDKHNNDEFFTKKFIEIKEAYDNLIDDNKRFIYDKNLNNKSTDSNNKNSNRSYNNGDDKEIINKLKEELIKSINEKERYKQEYEKIKRNIEIENDVNRKRKKVIFNKKNTKLNEYEIIVNNKSYPLHKINYVTCVKNQPKTTLGIILIIIGVCTLVFYIGFLLIFFGFILILPQTSKVLINIGNDDILIYEDNSKKSLYLASLINNLTSNK